MKEANQYLHIGHFSNLKYKYNLMQYNDQKNTDYKQHHLSSYRNQEYKKYITSYCPQNILFGSLYSLNHFHITGIMIYSYCILCEKNYRCYNNQKDNPKYIFYQLLSSRGLSNQYKFLHQYTNHNSNHNSSIMVDLPSCYYIILLDNLVCIHSYYQFVKSMNLNILSIINHLYTYHNDQYRLSINQDQLNRF